MRRELLTFTRFVAHLRRKHPVFRRRQFFFGRPFQGSEVKDRDTIPEPDAMGGRAVDDTFLVMLNAHHEPIDFRLPAHRKEVRWEPVLDTREPTGKARREALRGGDVYDLEGRSMAVLRLRRERQAGEVD